MANFMLLLRDNPTAFAGLSPAEMEAIIMRYVNWRETRAKQVVGGHKLRDGEGKVIAKGGAVTDGPFTEAKEVMGGLFMLEARDYDEAVAIAATCPHVDFGTVEVRQVQVMHD